MRTRTYLSRSRYDSPGALALAGGLAESSSAQSLPGLCAALPHNARSHDESARASLRQRNVRNGRNTSPYLDEIPIRAGCPGGTTGSPS